MESGIELLPVVEWHAAHEEKLHGSAATMKRFRRDLGLSQLMARSLCHMVRSLFSSVQLDPKVAKLEKEDKVVKEKKPNQSGGKEFFMSVCFMQARDALPPGVTKLSQAKVHQIVAEHGYLYNSSHQQGDSSMMMLPR